MRPDLAALIGSRICHDLISPIGAIGNGVELLTLTSDTKTDSPEFALITESVDSASARIRFFRIAYGAASPDQIISRKEIISVLEASSHGGRLNYCWHICDEQTRDGVRIAFLLMQCCETALPLGGNIDISRDGHFWEIKASGKRVDIHENLWDSIARPNLKVDHTPAQVQFALLPSALHEANRTLELSHTADEITLRF